MCKLNMAKSKAHLYVIVQTLLLLLEDRLATVVLKSCTPDLTLPRLKPDRRVNSPIS